MWRSILAFLAWLSADPVAVDREAPAAAAAVAVAYAQFAPLPAPPAPPPQQSPQCCKDCAGTGFVAGSAGSRKPCPCPAGCPCKAAGAAPCPGGKCPPPAGR
jgi:hypothetical protein